MISNRRMWNYLYIYAFVIVKANLVQVSN